MPKEFIKIINGYRDFRDKYASGDNSIMKTLSVQGQKPKTMFIACSDSRVDPAILLQCDPGDLFVVRNVANIIPPYEHDEKHHGTSAALEFAVCYLNIKNIVILGHSQCSGIHALCNRNELHQNDFITDWVTLVDYDETEGADIDTYAKSALIKSHHHCLTFPWIKSKVDNDELRIHLWFLDIEKGEILSYCHDSGKYIPLENQIQA